MLSNTKQLIWKQDVLTVKGLDLQLGGKRLFEEASFDLHRGSRVCLLGRNGAGKSTLFNWLAEEAKNPAHPWSVYLVEQELPPTDFSAVQTVLAADMERGTLWQRRAELELKQEAAELSDAEFQEYQEVCEELQARKADADAPEVQKILKGLGFSETQAARPLKELSGGWRARVAIARGLFMKPQLLLLDEPTNHIDLAAAVWLAEFCESWPNTLAVITHNAHFAHTVCNHVWQLNQRTIRSYKCSYNMYVKQRDQDYTKQVEDWKLVEKQLQAIKAKGAPDTQQKIQAFIQQKQADGIRPPERRYAPRFVLYDDEQSTTKTSLIDVTEASVGYSQTSPPILTDLTFAIYPRTITALVGPNGAGKTTFLRLLTGELTQTAGTVNRKPGLRTCFFHQHFYHDLPQDSTPIEYIQSVAAESLQGKSDEIRRLLGMTGMDGPTQNLEIKHLSGGQKARVYFAAIAAQQPDILILDEPSNHLDMETSEALLTALKEYRGAVVIVSHDLAFLEELSPEVWEISQGHLKKVGYGVVALTKYINSALAEQEQKPTVPTDRDPMKVIPFDQLPASTKRARQAALKAFFDKGRRKVIERNRKLLAEME
jgi:ATPase subunit of ABC transporter with duplicated ATPase domains